MVKKGTAIVLSLMMLLSFTLTAGAAPLTYEVTPSPEATISAQQSPTPAADATATPQATATLEATATPNSTPTPQATATQQSTVTPEATSPEQTATPSPEPTLPIATDNGQINRPLGSSNATYLLPQVDESLLTAAERKLSTQLLQLTNTKYLPDGTSKSELISSMQKNRQIVEKKGLASSSGVGVKVYIKLKKGYTVKSVKSYAMEILGDEGTLVAAVMDSTKLTKLAALSCVESVNPIMPPVVRKMDTTQGDAVLKSRDLRNAMGVDGSGIKVGVISDGVEGIASRQASGDLPSDVTVLDAGSGDEGVAMLEIVYDMAPGAKLYFHTCGEEITDFNSAIDELVNAGCTVIVDDIGWIFEPYFEDGPVASHIKNLLDSRRDIIYVSSAGNEGQYTASNGLSYASHYQGAYYNYYDSDIAANFHDFSKGKSKVLKSLYASIPAGESLMVVLQWNESFGNAKSDYDLYMWDYDNGGYPLTYSNMAQSGTHQPLEYFYFENNTGDEITGEIMVRKKSASTNKTLEIYAFGSGMAGLIDINTTSADSIFGHPAVPKVITCGAVDYETPNVIEEFSSQGPVTMLSGTRKKPDIVGTDGVATTVYNGFYGTSASAPHVAAIAALLKQRFPSENADSIRSLLLNNADDLGAKGFDAVYGYGLVNALKAGMNKNYVHYDTQGGSGINSLLLNDNVKISAPKAPTRPGFTFCGWFKDAGCTAPWDFSKDIVTQDTTLFAKWGYGITVLTSNKKYGSATGTGMFKPGDTITVTATPKSGYCFVGWLEGSTTVSTDMRYTFTVSSARTLKANFIALGKPAVQPISLVGYSRMRLTWTAVPYATGYEIRWGTSSSAKTLLATLGADTREFTTDPVSTGKRYYFKVRAIWNPAGSKTTYGPYSATKNVTPAFPTIVLAAGINDFHTATISWSSKNSLSTVDHYELSRSTSSKSGFTVIPGADALTGTSFVDANLNNGQTYYYRIRAFEKGTGTAGPYSAVKSIKPGCAVTLSVSANTSDSLRLNWQAVSGADGYDIYRKGTGAPVATGITALEYVDLGLATGSTYYYQVQPYAMVAGAKVYGTRSVYKYAKVVPAPVTGVALSNDSATSIKVQWDAVQGATGYQVYRAPSSAGRYSLSATTVSQEYVNAGLTTGKTYYFKVRAITAVSSKVSVYGGYSSVNSLTAQ